jgi:hypothetical protein
MEWSGDGGSGGGSTDHRACEPMERWTMNESRTLTLDMQGQVIEQRWRSAFSASRLSWVALPIQRLGRDTSTRSGSCRRHSL